MAVFQHCNTCGFEWSCTGGFDACPSCESEKVEDDEKAAPISQKLHELFTTQGDSVAYEGSQSPAKPDRKGCHSSE